MTTCPNDGDTLLPTSMLAEVDPDPTGEMVGEYLIERKLGEGGFGTVYRAVHPLIGKVGAVKVLHRSRSASAQMVSRFIAEARVVNQIRHKNIIDIFSFGRLPDGRHYFVMELLEGESLEDLVARRGRVSPEEAMPILGPVARALSAAHEAGVVHRDLKPDNIFLASDGAGGVEPKLLDFGIAKLSAESTPGHKTRTGAPMGTPHYMSPEQCGGLPIDPRSDIYAFGVLAFRLLTGELPFDAEGVLDILVMHTTRPPPLPSAVAPGLSVAIDAAILSMLEKRPDDRPPSMEQAFAALQRAADASMGSVAATPIEGAASTGAGKPPWGHRRPATAVANAETLADAPVAGPAATQPAATTNGQPPRPLVRRAAPWMGAGALVAVTAWLLGPFSETRSPGVSAAPSTSAPELDSRPPVAAASASGVSKGPEPAASGSASILETSVAVQIVGAPQAARVRLGSVDLGTSDQPIHLPRGSTPVKLLLVARDRAPTSLVIVPDADKKVQAPAMPTKRTEYENPF